MAEVTGEDSRPRRRRASSKQGAPPPRAVEAADQEFSGAEVARPERGPRKRGGGGGGADGERGLRDLVGAGPSQLGVSGALRGRDVDRPTAADLEEAQRTVRIVRRNWKPRA
jgi:hypothetical protein